MDVRPDPKRCPAHVPAGSAGREYLPARRARGDSVHGDLSDGVLLRWLERRYITLPAGFDVADFGAGPTASSITVTADRALEVPAIFACLQVLCQDIARTPIKFRRKPADDTYVDATEHDLWDILATLPNAEQTAYQFKHQMQWNVLLHGCAFAEIVRQDGRVVALWPLDPRSMRVDRDDSRRKRWRYTTSAGTVTTWTFDPSMPPIFELTHETPITRCRELIGTALALQIYVGKFFANGARVSGVLQAQGSVSQATADRLRDYWASTFGRPEIRTALPCWKAAWNTSRSPARTAMHS